MLEREPHGSGWRITLHAKGVLRFFPAAFLLLWLCGWAVGEYFAGTLLLALAGHALGQHEWTSWLPLMKGVPPEPPVQLAFAGFLLFWVSFWTWGGLTALGQFLALLFGREEIVIEGDTLELRHVALVTLRRARIEASQIRGFNRKHAALLVETRSKRYSVATLGSVEERDELAQLLNDWHRPRRQPNRAAEPATPAEGYFHVGVDETGMRSLVADVGLQRGLGVVLLVIGAGLAFGAWAIARHSDSPERWLGPAIAGGIGALFLYGGGWLTLVRESWHPRSGSLELRRHALGMTWTTLYQPVALELVASTDSDGDSRWTLEVRGEGRFRRFISSINDPNLPRSVGEWLSETTGAPLREKGEPSLFERAG